MPKTVDTLTNLLFLLCVLSVACFSAVAIIIYVSANASTEL
jgi:hypothetical protein